MRVYLILGLLFVGINGEKKINLEDIERDNLRAESTSKAQTVRGDESKYLIKPEINQQHYQIPSQYSGSTSSPDTYATSQQIQNIPAETYIQPSKYAVKEQTYQQQNGILPEQNLPLQYYSEYRQQSPTKGIAPNVYEPQQLIYQPEVTVGNQYQTIQQKAVTEKYSKNKETLYVDIPMSQLLAYYPNLDVNAVKNNRYLAQPLIHQLASAATDQVSIPIYTSAFSQKPIPLKPSYQVQYASKYTTGVPAAYTTKISKGAAYSSPVTSKKFTTSPLLSAPIYFPSDQSYAQGKQYLYTQAYIPQQTQYVPQLVYSEPATVYMHATPVYSDFYSRPPTYLQDNSLHGNVKQYSAPPQQLYEAPQVAENLPKHILRQQASHSISQNYVKVPDEPTSHFIPPQLPPSDFKSEDSSLLPVSSQEDESFPSQNHVGISEPRSLLDSYVPSKLIAAQDSARYRERPIKLEGGFLPSKENFLHKKRKSE